MVEIISSIEDLCRLCAGKIDVLMGINIFESDNRQIFKKICVCLPIQISINDNFPKMVCVDCACKLDLMFDFRERSILTEHLFSDMISVKNENIVNMEQSVALQNVNIVGETVFNTDFLGSKNNDKYNNSISANVGFSRDENILQENINLEESLSKSTESRIISNQIDKLECKGGNQNSRVVSHIELLHHKVKESTTDPKVFVNPEEDILGSRQDNKILGNENKELTSIRGNESIVNLNDCTGLDWFFCNICNQSFTEKNEFDVHNAEHLSNKKRTSKFNSNGIMANTETDPNKKKKSRKKNIKTSSDDRRNESKVCTECGKEYQTNYKLQEHMRKHTGEKPFLCSYQDCRKAFRSKIGLAQHEANHSGQFEFSCSTCGKGFQCKSYLVVHQRVHSDLKPYICKQCSHRFKTKQSLLDHMNRHLGVKPFLCDVCGRGFITKGLCKSHQKVHSGTDNRQYPCNVCRKLFVSKSYLNTHFRIHTGEKPFMCEVCGKGFLTRVDLRIHSTMHTGEKSFICEICGKAFARRDALRCHRRSHTGERPYKCEFCGQSFTQFSPMAIHKRLHTGERPYECDICRKAFVSRSTMISHRKKHHTSKNEGSQCQYMTVKLQEEQLDGQDQQTQQLMVIENSPQFLLALNKRNSTTEPTSDVHLLYKLKNEQEIPVD